MHPIDWKLKTALVDFWVFFAWESWQRDDRKRGMGPSQTGNCAAHIWSHCCYFAGKKNNLSSDWNSWLVKNMNWGLNNSFKSWKGHENVLKYVKSTLKVSEVTHIINIPRRPVLPAEVNQGVVRLLDVHHALAFVRRHHVSLQGHFTGTKLHQVFAGASSGAAHQAWKESAWRHLPVCLKTSWKTGRKGEGFISPFYCGMIN